MCFWIIALFVASCSYASNETDILNNTIDTDCINIPLSDLESDSYDNDSFEDMNSDIDNISIYYGERIDINWDFEENCSCTVYIDDKLANFLYDSGYGTVNMYYYDYTEYNDFLNSVYPDEGLHNISITFEFDTPQKYDIVVEVFRDELENSRVINYVWFYFHVNEDIKPHKRYSYNTTLNILKKDKTVHIMNISSASYSNPLCYEVIVDNPENSSFIFISNKTDIVISDISFGHMERTYYFDGLKHKIKPGVYNLTVVNEYDNTFDTASFTLCNDIIIDTTYKIKDNNVIFNVELECEYNTPIEFALYRIINGIPYEYRIVSKDILANTNAPKFNFEICFNDVEYSDYYISISDYWSTIDYFYFTVNYTNVDEYRSDNDIGVMNETVNVTDIVLKNISGIYGSNVSDNGANTNLDLKENIAKSNLYHAHKFNAEDIREGMGDFGDLISSVDSISREDANSYNLISKSPLKLSKNIFSNSGIIILLFIVFIIGFLMFKRE